MISYGGQVVVITGAGGGLGSVFAREIAKRGGQVVVNDLGGPVTGGSENSSTSYADTVAAQIVADGGVAIANYDTVATAEGGQAIIQSALDHFGRVDAVIANAGNMRYGSFESLSLEDLNALLAVHVGGAWNVVQAAWPYMKHQNYGRVVFATSSAGTLGNAALAAYGAAKGGVMGLMLNLSEAGAPHGILCNAFMPNAISRMTSDIKPEDLGGNPWSAAFGPYFAPDYAAGLVTYLASRSCSTHHGVYSSLGGRIGRTFIGVTNGIARDAPYDAETIDAEWDAIEDDRRGYGIPANNADEWRLVAELRGMQP